MKAEKELLTRIKEIEDMKVNEENKKTLLDFNNFNSINDLAISTRIIYLTLLKLQAYYVKTKGK